jgi:hypothetical protein
MIVRFACLALLLLAAPALAQQVPDTTYDTRVTHPAYAMGGPTVLFDEAHHNFHTTTGRYRVFAELLRHDGYRVIPNTRPFSAATLAGGSVLVIANALGADAIDDTAAAHDAFTPQECDAVRAWVHSGGALLLIADHVPMAQPRVLAERFGVGMRSGYTIDPELGDHDNPSFVTYTERRGRNVNHPILRGRDSTERVRRVLAFTGQSLTGPSESDPLLQLSSSAIDLMVAFGAPMDSVRPDQRRSAAGRSQALALKLGRGRVVVAGEAAMFSAQLAGPPGQDQFKMGMNQPGTDDRQFTLNVMHWLTGLLDGHAGPPHAASAAAGAAAVSIAPASAGAPAQSPRPATADSGAARDVGRACSTSSSPPIRRRRSGMV